MRKVAVIPTGEVVDRIGRMIFYLAPCYTGGSNDPLPAKGDPRRNTLTLNVVEKSWPS